MMELSNGFSIPGNMQGLDNMYLFDEYQIHAETESASLTLDYQNSQLLLHEDMAEYTDYPITADIPVTDSKIRYLSTFCASQDRVPSLRLCSS